MLSEASVLEGVSDEVTLTFGLLVLVVVAVAYVFGILGRNPFGLSNQEIHPSQRRHVEETREQLRQEDARTAHQGQGRERADQRLRSTRNISPDERCPICLENLRYMVETNCGHIFCTPCIFAYYNHGSWIGAMNCPVCRQQITIMFPGFTHEEDVSDEGTTYENQIRAYNRRFSGEPRTVWEYLMDFPVLARHLLRELFTVQGLVWMFRARVLLYLSLVVLYLISPLDLIPESVAGIVGLLDDIVIVLVVCVYVTVLYRQNIAGQ